MKERIGMMRKRLALALLGLGAVLMTLTGCMQDYALIPTAAIKGRILTSPRGLNKVGIRVSMVGTSTDQTPHTADYGFCDVEGDFVINTSRLGRGFVVARSLEYDAGYAPVYIKDYGNTVSVTQFIPSTSEVELFQKTSGKTRFLVFEDDWGKFNTVHVVFGFSDLKLSGGEALHDDGSLMDIDPNTPGTQTSGDHAAGDGVWTLYSSTLRSGDQAYGFVFDQDDSKVKRDPYEEFNTFSAGGTRSAVRVK